MSRGQRNNNPLNIRHGKSRWEGRTVFSHIIAAMTCVECGIRPEEVDRESIERGWRMAFTPSSSPQRRT